MFTYEKGTKSVRFNLGNGVITTGFVRLGRSNSNVGRLRRSNSTVERTSARPTTTLKRSKSSDNLNGDKKVKLWFQLVVLQPIMI